ncbi:MAG: CHRD domain-containing protein [Candidatus Nitrosopolaris sp.]|jgi:hypothetical protein
MNNLRISVLITSIIVLALVATPISSYAQQQTNFVATLSGKDMVPPVNTPATGVAKFHINPDGSLCYSIDVSHITGVLGAHIGTQNGSELADLINPYATTSSYPTGTIGAYPTASVNGTLTSGDIKAGIMGPPGRGGVISPLGLVGPLIGKNVTDLDKIVKSKDGYVTVRTVDHQRGEIQGQILPTTSTVNCLTTLRFAPPTTIPSPNSTRY